MLREKLICFDDCPGFHVGWCSDVPLREILEDIKPVYQIKDVKIDK